MFGDTFIRSVEIEGVEKSMLAEVKKSYEIWLAEAKQEDWSPSVEEAENFIALTMNDTVQEMLCKGATNEELGAFVRVVNGFIAGELLPVFELERYRVIFNNILALKEPLRTRQLSKLMDQMQGCFNIPLLNNEEFNRANREVIELYRAISMARNL